MNTRTTLSVSGLDDVCFADTRLSDVDGAKGRLVIAGRDVESPGDRKTFEAFAATLWNEGRAPSPDVVATAARAIAAGRMAAFEFVRGFSPALSLEGGMGAVRSALSMLDESFEDPARITGAAAVFAAAWARKRAGIEPIAPDATLGHSADLLRMLRGTRATDAEASALDAYLRTVSDHGMNASTFTARVVASTGANLRCSVVAAMGALEGPLHGGAPGPVLDMLDAIGREENAVAWLEAELASGRRIMGMGHRIYRVRDPRAAVFERAIEALDHGGHRTGRLALARAVERAAEGILRAKHPTRPLHANVEFYTAVLLDTLGVDREAFTVLFATGRIAGWCAHVAEQRAHGRLVRPASRYVGDPPASE
ncbi:MAG: citrate synthase [Myxococcales bacterium]|nr:citrate synthase [Myxococcales bacterium]